jgi:RHS repeat-associated protein
MVTTDRGDVRELLDESGAGFAHYYYDAYGVPSGILGAATARIPTPTVTAIASRQPLRYASYTLDESSGLYYCSQRYYDPAVAAFISKDPARADGEESAYQYCGGDPVGKVDPSGEAKRSAWGSIGVTYKTGEAGRYVVIDGEWVDYYMDVLWKRNATSVDLVLTLGVEKGRRSKVTFAGSYDRVGGARVRLQLSRPKRPVLGRRDLEYFQREVRFSKKAALQVSSARVWAEYSWSTMPDTLVVGYLSRPSAWLAMENPYRLRAGKPVSSRYF